MFLSLELRKLSIIQAALDEEGEEDLGGIASLLYRSPVQEDIIVLWEGKRDWKGYPPNSPKPISKLLPSSELSALESKATSPS